MGYIVSLHRCIYVYPNPLQHHPQFTNSGIKDMTSITTEDLDIVPTGVAVVEKLGMQTR